MSDTQNYTQKITEFYQRLNRNFEKQKKQKNPPAKLLNSIQLPDLLTIYETLLNNDGLKNDVIKNLKKGLPVRLSKELGYFVRTLNIIFDAENQDICLMLETKTKNAAGKKNRLTPVFSGTTKIVKPAWRIDLPTPVKYANAVTYGTEKNKFIALAKKEALIPLKISKKYSDYEACLHVVSTGAEFQKSGTRSIKPLHKYSEKISFYSKWANQSSLEFFLEGAEGRTLTFEERDLLTLQLLVAVKLMHDENTIHQDIKALNILISKQDESFYLEISDFGATVDENSGSHSVARATLGFESPEISAIHHIFKERKGFDYAYFHENATIRSLGRKQFLENITAYQKIIQVETEALIQPNKRNDMWAVGQVLLKLYHPTFATPEGKEKYANLISKLLSPNRLKRLTAQQALDQHYQSMMMKNQLKNISYLREALAQKRSEAKLATKRTRTARVPAVVTTPMPSPMRASSFMPTYKKQKNEAFSINDFLCVSPASQSEEDVLRYLNLSP